MLRSKHKNLFSRFWDFSFKNRILWGQDFGFPCVWGWTRKLFHYQIDSKKLPVSSGILQYWVATCRNATWQIPPRSLSTSLPVYLANAIFDTWRSLSLFLSFSLSLFLSFPLYRFLSFPLSRFLFSLFISFSLSLFLSFSLSLFLSFSLSLVVSFPRSLFLLFSPSLVLSFSLSRFLSFSRSLFLSFSLFLFLPFAPSRFLYLSLEMSNGIQQLVDSNMSKCDITDSTGNATRPHSTKSRNSYFSQNSNYTKIQFQFVLRDRYRQVWVSRFDGFWGALHFQGKLSYHVSTFCLNLKPQSTSCLNWKSLQI